MNNRQANRRRGRNNNNRGQNNNRGGVDRENRIDNRARGNAVQLLEKYKKLAQDAQVDGDRVQAEYYFQFADHYFRVNADTQSRREEQRRQRDEAREAARSDDDYEQNDDDADNRSERSDDEERKPRRRTRAPRNAPKEEKSGADKSEDVIDIDVLPPAIETAKDDEKPAPRQRRSRKKADDGDEEMAA